MNPFTEFPSSDYTFLKVAYKAGGNVVETEYAATGIVKLRDGIVQADNTETYKSTSTIHIRPDEPFIEAVGGNLVGHGIRVSNNVGESVDYRISNQVEGKDFDTNELAFYKVTVKKESFAPWPSELPIE